jgi:hypothetical protein
MARGSHRFFGRTIVIFVVNTLIRHYQTGGKVDSSEAEKGIRG